MPEWKHHQRLSACREQMSLHRFSLCGLGTLSSSHSSVLIGKSRAGCKGQSKLQALYRFYIPRVWDSSQKVRENTKYFEWIKRQKTRTITRTISQEICKFYSTFFFFFLWFKFWQFHTCIRHIVITFTSPYPLFSVSHSCQLLCSFQLVLVACMFSPVQVLRREPWLLYIHDCKDNARSRRNCYIVLLTILWVLHSFSPLFHDVCGAWGESDIESRLCLCMQVVPILWTESVCPVQK